MPDEPDALMQAVNSLLEERFQAGAYGGLVVGFLAGFLVTWLSLS